MTTRNEFITHSGHTLHFRLLDRRETKRQIDRFLASGRGDGWQLLDAFDRLFVYCAHGVVDDPPADAFSELPECLQPDDGDPGRLRAEWLRLAVLEDIRETSLLAASVCGLALGLTARQTRRLQKQITRG